MAGASAVKSCTKARAINGDTSSPSSLENYDESIGVVLQAFKAKDLLPKPPATTNDRAEENFYRQVVIWSLLQTLLTDGRIDSSAFLDYDNLYNTVSHALGASRLTCGKSTFRRCMATKTRKDLGGIKLAGLDKVRCQGCCSYYGTDRVLFNAL